MANTLARTFSEIGHILGVCPCCSDLFYLSEARPYLDGKQPHSVVWPAPGSEDTELGVLMEREVRHGEAEVYARIQA